MVFAMFWHLFFCATLLTGKVLSISSPGKLKREVGQNVVFMMNGTAMSEATWGVRDGNTNDLNPRLIRVFNPGGAFQDSKLNSTSYAGRVSFIGNLTRGQAWFKITNLNINDTNQYMAQILIGASNYENIPIQLTVIQPDITADPSITSSVSTSIITQSSTMFPSTNPPTLKYLTATLKVDRQFSDDMADKNSQSFKNFSSEFETEIKAAYTEESENNFKSVEVTRLSKGSILVTFIVIFESEIGYDKACAPLENAIKDGKLGKFQIIPGTLRCSEQDSFTRRPPSPTTGVHPGIIAGVVVVGILAIAGLVIAILFVCRKKSSHKDYRSSTSRQEYAMERRGEPEEHYACVQRSGASGAAESDKDNAPLPQYAAVDKNKKTKKKTRGPDELVYAELDHEHNKSIGARSPSDRHPTNDSNTVYADIQGSQGRQHPQQRQPPPRYGNLQAMDYA